MAKMFSNKVYRKAVAKIDRIFGWDVRNIGEQSTMWWDHESTISVYISKPYKHLGIRVAISKNGRAQQTYDCKSFRELRIAVKLVEAANFGVV